MSPATPATPPTHDREETQPRFGPFRSSPSPARPPARHSGAAGRLRIMLYRHRWLRWAAAATAALAVLTALGGDSPDPAQAPAEAAPPGPSTRLPPGTRGVPVPVDSTVFAVGDAVDVHAVLDGAAVVRAALVVEAGEDVDELIVAVPAEHVDATVDALSTGGVVLVLVPQPGPSESTTSSNDETPDS